MYGSGIQIISLISVLTIHGSIMDSPNTNIPISHMNSINQSALIFTPKAQSAPAAADAMPALVLLLGDPRVFGSSFPERIVAFRRYSKSLKHSDLLNKRCRHIIMF